MSSLLAPTPDRRIGNSGVYLLALGTASSGVLDLFWRDFDSAHQPIGDLGFAVPGRGVLACFVGIWMILAGTATIRPKTMRFGAWGMAIVYSIVGMFSLPLFYSMPHKYGFHLTLVLGILGRMFLQFILVAGCAIVAANSSGAATGSSRRRDRVLLAARVVFGLGAVLFGVAHLTNPKVVARLIPGWFPLQAHFWVVLTGIAFIAAGAAILTGVLSRLAAQMFALMLVVFEVILVPIIFKSPHVHSAWGGTAYNLAIVGSLLIFASTIPDHGFRQH